MAASACRSSLRTFAKPELAVAWIVPAVALGFLPIWALGAEPAVIAYAGMAAALLVYRRTPFLVRWLPEWVGLVTASGWWVTGAVLALSLTAPVDELTEGWSRVGERHGLPGLAALLASACVFAWSSRRPARPLCEHGLLVPVTALVYALAEALSAPQVIWAWLVVAGLLAAVVQVGPVRRRLTREALLVSGGSVLAVGVVSAWNLDTSLQAVVAHGRTAGWESIALATAAALLLALAFPDRSTRTNALWLPFLLAAQLSAMLLPGQYPLVAVAALAALASAVALARRPPAIAARRIDACVGRSAVIHSPVAAGRAPPEARSG